MLLQRGYGRNPSNCSFNTIRTLKELKNAGLIQGEINPPYIKYCINPENWEEANCYSQDSSGSKKI